MTGTADRKRAPRTSDRGGPGVGAAPAPTRAGRARRIRVSLALMVVALAGCGGSRASGVPGHRVGVVASPTGVASPKGTSMTGATEGADGPPAPSGAGVPVPATPGRPAVPGPLPASVLTTAPQPVAQTREILTRAAASGAGLRGLTWTSDRSGVMRTQVPGRVAERTWWSLRELVARTGRWPVVLGAPVDVECCNDASGSDLAAAARLDPGRWFTTRARESELETTPLDLLATMSGPRFEGHAFWTTKDSLTGAFHPRVAIALIPTPRPWEAAAYVGFGAWNDCPEPAVHVALARSWYDRWGAEVFALAGDQAEMYVWRPPTTAREAAEIGQQQYLYAYDNVLQGDPALDTREKYASALIGYHSWQFWWD